VTQQLTRRAWLVECGLYQATVLVGERGVLVVDPPARGPELARAVRELTPLPITTVVYSHSHLDHVGGTTGLLVDARLAGRDLRIVGNVNTVTELRRYGCQAPLPTEVVAVPWDGFSFEGEPVELVTPTFGHTRDNSIVLIPAERLAHNADVVYPGRLPAERFGHAEDLRGLEMALQGLLAQRWELLNAGHGDVGVHADVAFVLGCLDELRQATLEALHQLPRAASSTTRCPTTGRHHPRRADVLGMPAPLPLGACPGRAGRATVTRALPGTLADHPTRAVRRRSPGGGAGRPGRAAHGRPLRLRWRLGQGGMGVVWLAEDRVLHRPVAVKQVVLAGRASEEERRAARARVLREQRMAARVDHPGTVRVVDVAEDAGYPWIIMETHRWPAWPVSSEPFAPAAAARQAG
jgi:glyoxylase-like metal-dependent hydrolase (beta-lactamase superfamily II)